MKLFHFLVRQYQKWYDENHEGDGEDPYNETPIRNRDKTSKAHYRVTSIHVHKVSHHPLFISDNCAKIIQNEHQEYRETFKR